MLSLPARPGCFSRPPAFVLYDTVAVIVLFVPARLPRTRYNVAAIITGTVEARSKAQESSL